MPLLACAVFKKLLAHSYTTPMSHFFSCRYALDPSFFVAQPPGVLVSPCTYVILTLFR
jgi:hypothetical protein